MRLLFVFAQCFVTGALLMAQGQLTPDGSIQARNKAVAMRVFDEIFNQGKFQVADEIYAPDFQNHGLHRSVDLKTDQEAVHAEKKAFPDLRMSVQEMVAEGDKVAVECQNMQPSRTQRQTRPIEDSSGSSAIAPP